MKKNSISLFSLKMVFNSFKVLGKIRSSLPINHAYFPVEISTVLMAFNAKPKFSLFLL